jgi:hypothetical protein
MTVSAGSTVPALRPHVSMLIFLLFHILETCKKKGRKKEREEVLRIIQLSLCIPLDLATTLCGGNHRSRYHFLSPETDRKQDEAPKHRTLGNAETKHSRDKAFRKQFQVKNLRPLAHDEFTTPDTC